jgi:hypothetical protein
MLSFFRSAGETIGKGGGSYILKNWKGTQNGEGEGFSSGFETEWRGSLRVNVYS